MHALHLARAAAELGIAVVDRATAPESVSTDMSAGHTPVSSVVVLVARSAHGQAATWAPTSGIQDGGLRVWITPGLDQARSLPAQQAALAAAAAQGLVGVASVHFDDRLQIMEVSTRPDDAWLWTLDGALTSAYEQQVRALLDLPLGSTEMRAAMVVTAPIVIGTKSDMYYPYLHLFARDPGLRVHQRAGVSSGVVGHLAVLGEDFDELRERAKHAADYFSGVIEE